MFFVCVLLFLLLLPLPLPTEATITSGSLSLPNFDQVNSYRPYHLKGVLSLLPLTPGCSFSPTKLSGIQLVDWPEALTLGCLTQFKIWEEIEEKAPEVLGIIFFCNDTGLCETSSRGVDYWNYRSFGTVVYSVKVFGLVGLETTVTESLSEYTLTWTSPLWQANLWISFILHVGIFGYSAVRLVMVLREKQYNARLILLIMVTLGSLSMLISIPANPQATVYSFYFGQFLRVISRVAFFCSATTIFCVWNKAAGSLGHSRDWHFNLPLYLMYLLMFLWVILMLLIFLYYTVVKIPSAALLAFFGVTGALIIYQTVYVIILCAKINRTEHGAGLARGSELLRNSLITGGTTLCNIMTIVAFLLVERGDRNNQVLFWGYFVEYVVHVVIPVLVLLYLDYHRLRRIASSSKSEENSKNSHQMTA